MDNEEVKIRDRVITLEGSMKTAFNRLDDVDDAIREIRTDNKVLHEMNANIKVLAVNYESQGEKINAIEVDLKDLKSRPIPDVTELKTDVKELKEKPAKRWDSLVSTLIGLIASGVIGYIIGKALGG